MQRPELLPSRLLLVRTGRHLHTGGAVVEQRQWLVASSQRQWQSFQQWQWLRLRLRKPTLRTQSQLLEPLRCVRVEQCGFLVVLRSGLNKGTTSNYHFRVVSFFLYKPLSLPLFLV